MKTKATSRSKPEQLTRANKQLKTVDHYYLLSRFAQANIKFNIDKLRRGDAKQAGNVMNINGSVLVS